MRKEIKIKTWQIGSSTLVSKKQCQAPNKISANPSMILKDSSKNQK
jgi:hypothetical protein